MRFVLLTALVTIGCAGERRDHDRHAPDAGRVDLRSVDACAECHPTVVAEYRQSMHARAHEGADPIFTGVRRLRMQKEGEAVRLTCHRCHSPRLVTEPGHPPVGVGCFDCHGPSAGAPDGTLLGPRDLAANLTPAHGTGRSSPTIADGTSACQTCHAELKSPAGLTICTTGVEHRGVAATGTCSSCHMPKVRGPGTVDGRAREHVSHEFLGPHRAWSSDDARFLATAVELRGRLSAAGLQITVQNKSGHDFPTGFPGRLAIIGCLGRDAAGAEAWRCPDQQLGKVYLDAEGRPTLAPWATTLASDTRLLAGQTRDVSLEPPANVAEVEVTLSMRLLPAALASKIGLADAPEGQPRRVTSLTLRRQ